MWKKILKKDWKLWPWKIFSSETLETVDVEEIFKEKIGNCGCGRNFQIKVRKSWMWKIFSKKS